MASGWEEQLQCWIRTHWRTGLNEVNPREGCCDEFDLQNNLCGWLQVYGCWATGRGLTGGDIVVFTRSTDRECPGGIRRIWFNSTCAILFVLWHFENIGKVLSVRAVRHFRTKQVELHTWLFSCRSMLLSLWHGTASMIRSSNNPDFQQIANRRGVRWIWEWKRCESESPKSLSVDWPPTIQSPLLMTMIL